MAVKAGGRILQTTASFVNVIAKAKANNMPNDTIDRGIKKAAGADSADSYEKLYMRDMSERCCYYRRDSYR